MSGNERPARRATVSWILYDLANTTFSFNIVSLYFSLWVVNEMGGSDTTYGLANSLSMLVIFAFSPLLGALTDQAPRRMPFLVVASLVCVAATALLGRVGLAGSLLLFATANIAYQAGLQFYDSLLPVVSTPATRGRVGGIGIGAGYAGALLAFGVGFAITRGATDADRAARYADVFLATAVLFLVFALPCFLFVRERARPTSGIGARAAIAAFRQVQETFLSLRRRPRLARFLVGRAFYTDAVNTVIAFMGIYVTNAVGMSAVEAQLVLAVAIVFAAIGGFAWGGVVDRIGPKRTLMRVLALWVVVFTWATAVGLFHLPPASFWPVPALAGIALGGTWSADRPLMLMLTPPARVGEYYGLYGMVGRFSAVTGPLLWALVADRLGLGRPAAVASLLVFIGVAVLILRPLDPREDTDLYGAPGV